MLAPEVRVLLYGCGDLGTGAAHALYSAGMHVAIVERAIPLAVRRLVAFAEAARSGEVVVEGVHCRRVEAVESLAAPRSFFIPLVVAPVEAALTAFGPSAIIDARMTKRPFEVKTPPGVFRVALGPGHEAGDDCDAVVETLRGPTLGQVLWSGAPEPNTHVPGSIGGETARRVLWAPAAGILHVEAPIGSRVEPGTIVARVEGMPIVASIGGLLRGLLADGDRVQAGQKLGDIDPRPEAPPADRITDKSRTVGAAVRAAIRQRFGLEL